MANVSIKLPFTILKWFKSADIRVICSRSRHYTRNLQPRQSNQLEHDVIEKHRTSRLASDREKPEPQPTVTHLPDTYRDKYVEFLPRIEWSLRDRIFEKLERQDMYRRRDIIDIPEFYVGSIMAVTTSDKYSPGKTSRFVGICIQRDKTGLRHTFTLRNIIDEEGIEVLYEMYSPTIQQIEVLKLEKRLDDELLYLRDAPLAYSTFPEDMEPVVLPEGSDVPLNTVKVPINPRPWTRKWNLKTLYGIQELILSPRQIMRRDNPMVQKKWEKHDIVLDYRRSINPHDTGKIMSEVHKHEERWASKRKRKAKKSS